MQKFIKRPSQPSGSQVKHAVRGAAMAALMVLGVASSALAERVVVELQPSEVAPFIRQNPKVVVQFTSPDRGCGYCIGADKTFTEGVTQLGMDGWKYVRVQWPRWRDMPTFDAPVKVSGVPDHQIYTDGAYKGSAGGRAKDAATLMASIEGKVNPPQQAPAPLITDDLRKGLRAYALKQVLGQTLHECERNHYDNKPTFVSQMQAWSSANAVDLKLGTRAMLSTLGTKTHSYKDEMAREAQVTLIRLQKSFGLEEGKPWPQEQCDALARQLDTF